MIKRVLIAYDGSPCADAALEELSHAGLPSELEVTVICVADVWLPPASDQAEPVLSATLPTAVRNAREQAVRAVESSRALAEQACARLKKSFPTWTLETFATGDSPGWAIVKKADAWKADLVALGSHGRSMLEQFFLGSVASKVAAEAHCSVRIARPSRHSHASRLRILIAVDGSADSEGAVRAIAARTWPFFAEFRVVTVIDPRLQTALAASGSGLNDNRWLLPHDEGAGEWVPRMAEDFVAILREAGLKAISHIFEGEPKQVLIKEAETWEADCLFLGARGLHHGNRLFLGSLASAVATRAHCSVEIVRPKRVSGQTANTRTV